MSSIEINSVLAQIRALQQQTGANTPPAHGAAAPAGETVATSAGFGSVLQQGIGAVNSLQTESRELQQRFELGDPSADLATVMLASSKSSVAFRGMVEARNRLVSAYQDIMNMPI